MDNGFVIKTRNTEATYLSIIIFSVTLDGRFSKASQKASVVSMRFSILVVY
jgi:hypothetical protein